MAITFSYEILGMTTITSGNTSGVVSRVDYRFKGVEDETKLTAEVPGATPIDTTQPATGYTNISELTEDEVVTWVDSAVKATPGYYDYLTKTITDKINEQKNVPVYVPTNSLPWAANTADTANTTATAETTTTANTGTTA